MANVSPSSLIRASSGDLTMIVATFAGNANTEDTWVSGIQGIIGVVAEVISADKTSTAGGAEVSDASTGTITLYMGTDASTVTLLVYCRS